MCKYNIKRKVPLQYATSEGVAIATIFAKQHTVPSPLRGLFCYLLSIYTFYYLPNIDMTKEEIKKIVLEYESNDAIMCIYSVLKDVKPKWAFLFWALLKARAKSDNNYFDMPCSKLTEETELSKEQIKTARNKLIDKWWITIKKEWLPYRIRYSINEEKLCNSIIQN